jgi:hypothetical protein
VTPKAQGKIRKYKLDYFKKFSSWKGTVNRVKGQSMEWEKILGNHLSDRGLVVRTCQEPLDPTKPTNQLKYGPNILNKHFSKDVQMTNTYMRWSAPLIIREMQIKATGSYHITAIRTAVFKHTKKETIPRTGNVVQKLESWCTFGKNIS